MNFRSLVDLEDSENDEVRIDSVERTNVLTGS